MPNQFKTIRRKEKNCKDVIIQNLKSKMVQFHPEVVHTQKGTKPLKNFVFKIWNAKSLVCEYF